jgi:choline dehydrogenase
MIGRLRVGLEWLLARRGPLAMSLNQGGGFCRLAPDAAVPDLQLYIQPLSYERAPEGVRPLMSPDPFPGFSLSVSPCKPLSRGRLRIASADPAAAPVIEPGYLDDPRDLAQLVAGTRLLRRLAATRSLAPAIARELKPGPETHTDADIAADIRARATTVYHPCGTCRMGPDAATAVIDPNLRAHGIGGLRVADAAIFPEIPSGNTNAPAMMVGEMAFRRITAHA